MKLLDQNQEPIFAQLATDPKFSQTASEFLQPRSYGERHYDGQTLSLHTIEDCAACAPHRIEFLAKTITLEPPSPVVVQINRAARQTARAHGPQSKKKR